MAPTGKTFRLRINNIGKAVQFQRSYKKKQDQIAEAVEYCKLHGCRGQRALSSGCFPLIKDPKTINRRLDETITHGLKKQHCSILLPEEETIVVTHMIHKSRSLQPVSRKEANNIVMSLLLRQINILEAAEDKSPL